MNNVFISSAKKNEVVENFVRSKREKLEKMIPGFVDDRKFTDIVLNFYKRGIRDGAQMMLDTLEIKEVDLEKEIDEYMKLHHLHIKDGGRIIFENDDTPNFMCDFHDIAKYFFELGIKSKGE